MALNTYLKLVKEYQDLEKEVSEKQEIVDTVTNQIRDTEKEKEMSQLKRGVEYEDSTTAHVHELIAANNDAISSVNEDRRSRGQNKVGHDHPLIWKEKNLDSELIDIGRDRADRCKKLPELRELKDSLLDEVPKLGKGLLESQIKLWEICFKRDTILLQVLELECFEIDSVDELEGVEYLKSRYGWHGKIKVSATGQDSIALKKRATELGLRLHHHR